MVAAIALVIFVIVAVLVILVSGVKIVQPYEQAIYMRLGKYIKTLDQGFNVVVPLINEVVKLDLRTQVLDVPRQEVITKDNSPVYVDAVIYTKVIDPVKAFFEVTNYRTATMYLAQTTLRSVVGEMELDQIFSNRESINLQLRDTLDESTDKWGVKVEAVEIREVDPAARVKESMEEQTSAERKRRAAILEADGKKRAAILEAEGKKRARILEAEGVRQSKILEAEGERTAIVLQSQGEAQKLRILSLGASTLDSKAITVLSLETLKGLGEGEASKFFFPMELTRLAQGMSEYMGTGTAVPERGISDLKDLTKALGLPEDLLGPVPRVDDIRAQADAMTEDLEEEMKESAKIAQKASKASKEDVEELIRDQKE